MRIVPLHASETAPVRRAWSCSWETPDAGRMVDHEADRARLLRASRLPRGPDITGPSGLRRRVGPDALLGVFDREHQRGTAGSARGWDRRKTGSGRAQLPGRVDRGALPATAEGRPRREHPVRLLRPDGVAALPGILHPARRRGDRSVVSGLAGAPPGRARLAGGRRDRRRDQRRFGGTPIKLVTAAQARKGSGYALAVPIDGRISQGRTAAARLSNRVRLRPDSWRSRTGPRTGPARRSAGRRARPG